MLVVLMKKCYQFLFSFISPNAIWHFDINYDFQMLLVHSFLLMVNLLEVFLWASLFSVSLLVVCACPYCIKGSVSNFEALLFLYLVSHNSSCV